MKIYDGITTGSAARGSRPPPCEHRYSNSGSIIKIRNSSNS